MGKKFRKFRILEKIIHRKQKIYMVHTLFLTDSCNFNPAKYTTYMVSGDVCIKHTTVQPVNFADKYFAIFQFFPILWIKCLRLFTRERHCTCAESCFVQKIKFYKN